MKEKYRLNIKKEFLIAYIFIFAFTTFFYVIEDIPTVRGEWDDYSLVTVSLVNDHNFSISDNDILKAEELFPEWSEFFENYDPVSKSGLSKYSNNSGILSHYFGTYSLVCVPSLLLLIFLRLPAVYAFALTNWICLIGCVLLCYKNSRLSGKYRTFLILFLTINPIIAYLRWISAEVFIYSLIVATMLWWYNREYKKAAIAISLASSLNPVILVFGIIMVLEFFYSMLSKAKVNNKRTLWNCISENTTNIISYGCCYIVALIPFAYNYYNTGQFNLIANNSVLGNLANYATTINKTTTVWQRFWAYLFDLNFGFLPFFSLVFLLFLILLTEATIRRRYLYILSALGFLGVMVAYSVMSHINCGMQGISRYNAWNAPVMLFAIIYYCDKYKKGRLQNRFLTGIYSLSLMILLALTVEINFVKDNYYDDYKYMGPVAKIVLEKAPALYNPLPSTFYSRIEHVNGGYDYVAPVYYTDSNGCIRKIWVDDESIDDVLNDLSGDDDDMEWLENKLTSIDQEGYVSIGSSHTIVNAASYTTGDIVSLSETDWNGDQYFIDGIGIGEEQYTWTTKRRVIFTCKIEDYDSKKNYSISFHITGIYNGKQRIIVTESGQTIENTEVSSIGELEFEIYPQTNGFVYLTINLPDAISPSKLGESTDKRNLALQLTSVTIEAK